MIMLTKDLVEHAQMINHLIVSRPRLVGESPLVLLSPRYWISCGNLQKVDVTRQNKFKIATNIVQQMTLLLRDDDDDDDLSLHL